jgi:branched-chain amino acid transport system permease protein
MKGGLSFWLALPIATIITAIVTLFLGLLITRYAGVGFVVFTLLICFMMERVFGNVKFLGGWGGIIGIPSPDPICLPFIGDIEFSSKISYYYLSLSLLLLTILFFHGLYSCRIGRAWRAIKLDPRLAEAVGVYVFGYRLAAFVLASAFAGLAGSFHAHHSMTINPETFGILKSIHIQVYAILGGLDSYILGPLSGAIVFTLLPEFLQISPEIEPYVTGFTLIFIVILLPRGLAGVARKLLRALVKLGQVGKISIIGWRSSAVGVAKDSEMQ